MVLTLGTPGPHGHALTHRVVDVERIDVLSDDRGIVRVLRVSGGRPQTLVSFGA